MFMKIFGLIKTINTQLFINQVYLLHKNNNNIKQ